ncbi:MAG: hypothetical protein MJ250_08500, partial [Alphaproteobacteria bacterium]|nr:hypothetical protein [Alphaproteobacteria bacterium]
MRLTRTTLKELSRKYRAVLNRCLLMSMALGIVRPALAETETIPSPAPAHGYYLEKISDVVPGTIAYGHVTLDGKYYVIKGTFGHNEDADHIAYYKWNTSDKKLVGADSASADIIVKHYDTATRLENLTGNVEKKTFKEISGSENGGAIYNSSTNSFNITDSDFISNSAKYGGAIYNLNSATIENITGDFISNSVTTYHGGAIYNNQGEIKKIEGDFISNSAGTHGGAIENDRGTLGNITGNFTSNSAGYGGAIDNLQGKITSITGNFTSNIAGTNGGAIFSESYATIGSITGDFISNSATNGGAIYNLNSATIDTLAGDFISNSATNGGAIYNDAGTVHIVANDKNIKFEGNTANKGGAIYNKGTIGLYAQSGKSISFIGDNSNPETDSIYNEGIINIGGTHNSVISLQKLDNLGKIYVNGGTTIFNKVNGNGSGTIDIKNGSVILNNTIENNTLNLSQNGTLKTAARDFTISAPIHSTKGTLDLKNNVITTTTMSNLTGTLNVLVDVDLSASQMDKINITTNNGGILIKNINLMGTTQQNSLTLDFINSETFVSSAINNISYNGENYSVSYDYYTGRLILTKTSALPTPIKKTQDNGVASSVSTNTVVSSVINANRMVYQSRPFSSVSSKKNVQGKSGGDKSQYGL